MKGSCPGAVMYNKMYQQLEDQAFVRRYCEPCLEYHDKPLVMDEDGMVLCPDDLST